MEKHNPHNNKTNNIKNTTDQASEAIIKWINFEAQKYIWRIGSLLFWTKDWLFDASYYTDYLKDCDDGATLFTIIRINWKNTLVKVWAWKFNIESFNQKDVNKDQEHVEKYKHIKGLRHTPIPLFVVSQSNSSFANEQQKNNMIEKPQKYLKNNSIIAIPSKRRAYLTNNKELDFKEIHIPNLDEAKKKINNTIININIPKSRQHYLKSIMKELQNMTFKGFSKKIGNKIWNIDNPKSEIFHKLKYLLELMVPENWNKKQMYELVQSYNINRAEFI